MNSIDISPDFSPLGKDDAPQVMRIFNYYVEHSAAAFFEDSVPEPFYFKMLELLGSYPSAAIRTTNGRIVGFGMVRLHNPLPVFRHTGEITYFIDPQFTGRGLGGNLLTYLEGKARECGITCILAQISSKNYGSISFHKKNGFVESGRLTKIGKKNEEFFDIIWMQKEI
jgi:phosphinothricin acetyltransferase